MKKEKILYIVIALLLIVVAVESYYLGKSDNGEKSVKTVSRPQPKSKELQKLYTTNPFERMQQLQAEMEKAFNSMNSQFAMIPEFKDFFSDMTIAPSIDMKELKDRYEIKVNIPGSDKNSINISAKDGILRIEAKTERKVDEKRDNFIRKEIYSGSFLREIPLPNDANAEKLKSSYKDGVLSITIPKK